MFRADAVWSVMQGRVAQDKASCLRAQARELHGKTRRTDLFGLGLVVPTHERTFCRQIFDIVK
ncbi:MAG: hypothetical protein ACI86S_000407 [Paracoccaceae bacterium]|jgi:hypothetical protein